MKQVEIQISVDPKFFGESANNETVESFAFNLKRYVEKTFDVKCDYSVECIDNSYTVNSTDSRLQLEVSEFIENNWHATAPYSLV
jgi:hypothetical protein